MGIFKDHFSNTVTIKNTVNEQDITIMAMQNGCEGGTIIINFNRYRHSHTDVVGMLLDLLVRSVLKKERIIGDFTPLRMTEAERLAIYDHKHDEIFDENQNENENENEKFI